jgi:5-methyltetrahydropteroyltriglutamate--homocysteine methyltransferase
MREERAMKISSDHVLTTHTGSLPRPQQLIDLVYCKQEGKTVDDAAFDTMVSKTVDELVHRQADIGVDVVSDGEVSKPGFVNYIARRLAGFGGVGAPWALGDMDDLPELVMEQYGGAAGQHILMPECVGPVSYVGQDEVQQDIARLKHAVGQSHVVEAFIPATSPGCVTMCAANKHYPSYEDYLWAVADAMAEEYRAIVNAGFVLQLDCPDIPMIAHTRGWQDGKKIYGVRGHAELHIQAINRAVKGLPPEMIRLHMCWGNYSGPHHHDVPLSEILQPVLAANVAAYSFEGANPQHEHEWTLFQNVKLAPDKIIIPGVIDTKTNVLEHPELVAQRIERYTGLVGRERVIAGTDCGFGTFVGFGAVHPKVAWLKLDALVRGAQLASKRLWS